MLCYSLVVSSATGAEAEKSTRLFKTAHHFFRGDLHSDLLCSTILGFSHCKQADIYVKLQVPDNGVPLSVSNVGIVCEQDGVVGHHRLARGKNSAYNIAHTVQNAIINQEVIDQQLIRQRMSVENKKKVKPLRFSQQTRKLTPNSFTPRCGVFE